jgi:hypothetical protein
MLRRILARLGPGRVRLAVGLASIVALLVAIPVLANLSGSSFEGNDGNLVVDTPGNTDWANAPNRVVGLDQPSGPSDNSFGQGTKEDDPSATVVTGSIPPNKNDLSRFYVGSEFASNSNYLYLAWERLVNIGSANLDLEINQNTTAGFTGTTTGPVTLNRTAGDLLVSYDFSGSGTPTLGLLTWVTSGPTSQCFTSNTLPCWGNRVNLSAAGSAEGAVNTGTVTDPVPPGAPRILTTGLFGEAAINLTAAGVFPTGTCKAFGSTFLKSRASSSFGAEVKDFIAPQPVNISNCGEIKIDKVTDPSGDPKSFDFTLTGGPSNLNQSFSLTDAATPHSSGQIQAGSGYNAAETVPAGWDLTSATCDDGSPVTNIDVSADEVVTCTFTDRKRGHIIIDKVTDPSGSAQSFDFTLTGGPSTLNQSFSLTDGATPHDSGAILPGSGYAADETVPTGWDLTSATCDDGSPVSNIDVAAGETVTCTFNDRERGAVSIHKEDDAGHALAGAEFTLFADNPPTGGTRGAEDTSTGKTCTTDANGDCTISNIVPGEYWIVETVTPPGHDPADDKHVTVTAGHTTSVTLVDPRRFKIVVLVCRESDNTLYPSTVTVDGTDKTSLNTGGGGSVSDADLCGLGGASYGGKHTGNHPGNVNIPTTP